MLKIWFMAWSSNSTWKYDKKSPATKFVMGKRQGIDSKNHFFSSSFSKQGLKLPLYIISPHFQKCLSHSYEIHSKIQNFLSSSQETLFLKFPTNTSLHHRKLHGPSSSTVKPPWFLPPDIVDYVALPSTKKSACLSLRCKPVRASDLLLFRFAFFFSFSNSDLDLFDCLNIINYCMKWILIIW